MAKKATIDTKEDRVMKVMAEKAVVKNQLRIRKRTPNNDDFTMIAAWVNAMDELLILSSMALVEYSELLKFSAI